MNLLESLFSPDLTQRWEAAFVLYAPDGLDSPYLREESVQRISMANRLLSLLETAEKTEQGIITAVGSVAQQVRDIPVQAFDAAELAVSLRPMRTLKLGELAADVCDTLYDFYRGRWAAKLTRPDNYTLRTALAVTLAAMPPHSLKPFWEGLQSNDAMTNGAMRMGLEFLRANHAADSLLFGLTYCKDHHLQGAIVDCLEQVGDPRVLPTLHRLRRETATTDWTLSRHLSRAIAVIERQNAGQHARTLLRPTSEVTEDTESLLRPLSEEARNEWERRSLLRSRFGSDSSQDMPPV